MKHFAFVILVLVTGCSATESVKKLNEAKMGSLKNYAENVDILVLSISEAYKKQAFIHIDYVFNKSIVEASKSQDHNGFVPLDIVQRAIVIRDAKKAEVEREFAKNLQDLEKVKLDLQDVFDFEYNLQQYLYKQGISIKYVKSIGDMIIKNMQKPSHRDGAEGD